MVGKGNYNMYELFIGGKSFGKMNGEELQAWLLERRTNIQAEIIIQNINCFGRWSNKDIVIRKFVGKI